VNKGNCLLDDLGRLEEATKCFKQVLALAPEDNASRASLDQARQQLIRIDRRKRASSG
jgi:predicted RNA polymerase sigma factor